MSKPIPKHIRQKWGSAREFKQDKRYMLRKVEYDLRELQRGCAFMPGGRRVSRMLTQVRLLLRECSAKQWGR